MPDVRRSVLDHYPADCVEVAWRKYFARDDRGPPDLNEVRRLCRNEWLRVIKRRVNRGNKANQNKTKRRRVG